MNIVYFENGAGYNWLQMIIAGTTAYMTYNDGGTYIYHCYGIPGKGLTDEGWAVRRVTVATGRLMWAGGLISPSYKATDLTYVAALSYV